MNINNLREFLNDLFTLRTVWIDRGGGKWSVKRKLHPLLKSVFWTLALIVGAGIYSNINNMPTSEAQAGNNIITASSQTGNNINMAKSQAGNNINMQNSHAQAGNNIFASRLIEVDEQEAAPPVNASAPQQIIIPLNNKTANKYEIILPSERDPNEGRIIKSPLINPNAPKSDAPRTKIPANNGKYHIQINKSEYTLSLFKGDELVKVYPIAVGKNPGDKQKVGDNRTPTGNFKIVSIENASTWSHNFRDGKGNIKGAYGPWFLRLDAKGWKGIGIHGTHDPASLGTNATEGCIRLQNDDIAELKQFAYKNMPVSISEN